MHPRPIPRGSSETSAVVILTAVTVVVTGCAPTRSVEAFCSTMDKHKTAYLEQMNSADGGSLGGLFSAVGAVGDLKIMWDELATVAPSEIQADVESVAETWKKQEDNASNGNWLGSLSTALLNSGAISRVDTYVRENCDARP
ncbi:MULTISPECIES: hypothetical protein [Microbacterium]|uniref:hypothetical protein n=1 Tax=Microbacterium TaxID=33882 RepID=UPI00278191E4|nr:MULTISPECIES: hypothetical protein [Microbacterium]MDQ1084689.1 hypothetical protein [Microbacterium sp. SORGH_AS_0344]MDQ1170034.1 hypothetical protein [Microbacterium proteolyticum]